MAMEIVGRAPAIEPRAARSRREVRSDDDISGAKCRASARPEQHIGRFSEAFRAALKATAGV
jgi:hypothetical protein